MSWTFKEACFLVIYKLLYFLFVVHFQVKNLIEKPENDHLPLIEASRLVITFILYLFYPFGSFKWSELETVDRTERLKPTACQMVRLRYISALVLLGMTTKVAYGQKTNPSIDLEAWFDQVIYVR